MIVDVEVSEPMAAEMIEKGSVAVDGISLTINSCGKMGFSVSIIPTRPKITTIGFKKVGDLVNIETDMLGKYVKKFLAGQRSSANDAGAEDESDISISFLAQKRFFITAAKLGLV